MRLTLDKAALALAMAACVLVFTSPGSPLSLWLAFASLPFCLWEISRNPHRILFVIGFGLLGVTVLLLAWPLPPGTGKTWIPFSLLGLQIRLAFLSLAESRRKLNGLFAAELKDSLPENCLLFIDNDIETQTSRDALSADHIVRTQAGETLAADGIVSFGSGFTEELSLTGDPEPVSKGIGKFVFAGSKNKNSNFLFRVVNAGHSTFLWKKAEFLRLGFAEPPLLAPRYLILEVISLLSLIALHAVLEDSSNILLGVWLSSFGAIYGAGSWALGLALTSRSAAAGVIWRSLADVKATAKSVTLVTDPEATVMVASLRLSGVGTEESVAEEGALRLAAPLARRIESPACYSILRELRMRNIPLELLDSYTTAPGGGIGIVAGEEVRLCDEATVLAEQIPFGQFSSFLTQEMNRPGASAMFLLKDGLVIAVFTFVDTVRADSVEAVHSLSRAGISLILISAARKESVAALAEEIGVTHFHGEARPATAEDLLMKLENDGLYPVWLDNGLVPVPIGKFPKIVTPLARFRGGAISARWDLVGAWQVIRLARTYLSYAREQFLISLFLQLVFAGICLRWPLIGAAGAALLGILFLCLPVKRLASGPLR